MLDAAVLPLIQYVADDAIRTDKGISDPGPLAIISLLYCIIFPTVIAFTLQNTWQRYLSPTQAGLLYTLDPVWCLLGGMIFLHETLSRQEWLGCALLFSAVLLPVLLRLVREERSPA
jgi:drug/metabolite transporter (DMT)-like permease